MKWIDKLGEKLTTNRIVKILVIFYFIVSVSGNFFDSVRSLYHAGQFVIARFEKSEISDEVLISQSVDLAKVMSNYVKDRNISEPQMDFDNFNLSVSQSMSYNQETIGYYYSNFYTKIASLRQEYLKRGIHNDDLEQLYKNPTNPLGLQAVANGINEMAAQLLSNRKS